jgi:hypothetical protein
LQCLRAETVPQAVTYVSSIQDTERELVATGSVKLPEYADLVSDFSSNHHGHGYHACLLEADGYDLGIAVYCCCSASLA